MGIKLKLNRYSQCKRCNGETVPTAEIVSSPAFPRATALRLLAAASVGIPSAVGAQASPAIRVGIESLGETFAEPRYGVESGIFGKNGLNIQLSEFASAGPIVSALVGGSLDVGMGDVILLANAVNRGLPIVAIAASGLFRTSDPISGLCVLKNSAIKSPRDLEGQTIAVGTLVSLTTVSLRMWLTQNGVNPEKVQLIEMRFPEMAAALQRGNVLAAAMVEPSITQNADSIRLFAVPYGAIGPVFPISLVLTSRAWLAANAPLAKRVADAIYDTARWANSHRAQTGAILANVAKVDPAIVNRMHRTYFATSFDPAPLQAILNIAAANKLIDRPTQAADLIARLG